MIIEYVSSRHRSFFIDSIIIPIDTSYFTLDAFYLGALNNGLLLNNSQYNIQTFGGNTQLRLKLGNLTAPPPGMFNTVAGLSGSYSYFFTDTLYAVLKLRFKCDGNYNALKTCTQHQLRLAFGNAAIKYKTLCTLLINPTASFSSSSIEIHAVSNYTGFIQGFIGNTDIDLGASGAMPVGFKFTASDTLQNPFSIQAGQNNLLYCDSVTYYAYLQVPDHITINTFNFKSPDFIIDNNDVSVSTFNGYKYYLIQYGHALQTYNAINNTTYSPAKAHITFDAIYSGGCPFSPATFGIDTIFIQYRAQCGGCENCYRSLACQSVLLFVHCAEICGNAVTGTEEVLLQRASFGWATRQDYLNGNVPYQAADLATLLTAAQFQEETHKVYACDSVWLHAQGFTVDTIDLYSLSFELSYMPPGGLAVAENIFSWMHGTATLISTDSYDTLHISLSNPTVSIGYAASFDTLLIMKFNLLSNQNSDSLLNQYSYHIYLDGWLRVMPPATLAAGAYFIPQIRGEFVNTNSDPDNFLEHSCDPWGDLMTLLIIQVNLLNDIVPVGHATSPSMFTISTPWPMMNACTARTRIGLQIQGGLGINTDDFPFEFRPQVFFETLPTVTYSLSNLMMLSGASNFLPLQNYTVINNTIQIPNNLRALEKADPLLVQSAFAWMLLHRRECYNEADTINFSDIVNRAYADTPCRVNMGWNDLVAPNYSCDNIPLQLPVIADTIITIADTTIFNIPFSYYYPGSNPQSPLPNVWFHYTASGFNGQQLPIDTAYGSDNQVRLHNILNGYGYFMTDDTTYALVSTTGQKLRLKLPTPCAEGDTFTVTLRYGALCNDSLFALYLNGTLLPDSQSVCNVCSRTITIIRAPAAAQLVDQSFTDSCGRIYWHLNVHNNSNAPLYTGTLILRHPLSLPYSALHSSVSYNGTTQIPLAPASYSYLTWSLFPGDTLPALALNLPSTAADTLAPHDTAFYTLAFDVDCSFVAEQLQAMYAGFGLCENFFNFDTLTAVIFNNYGADTCCTNSLEAFGDTLLLSCGGTYQYTVHINDSLSLFTATLTTLANDTLFIVDSLDYGTPYTYCCLSTGEYVIHILNNSTFIQHNMIVVVDTISSIVDTSVITITNNYSLCAGTAAILQTDTSFSYFLWSNGSTTDTAMAIAPGTYWVKLFNSDSCFVAYASITINADCYNDTLLSNPTASGLINAGISGFDDSMGTIYISGTFTIDEDFYFQHAHIIMGPNALIRVLDGSLLSIEDSTTIEGCCLSWQGIYVNYNAGIVVRNATIKHAHVAAVRSFGKPLAYSIVGSRFINNQTALWIQPAGNDNSDNNLHLQYSDYENALIAANDFINDTINNLIIKYDDQPNYLRGKNGIRFWNYRQTNSGIENGTEDVMIPIGNVSMNKNRFINLKTLGVSVINGSTLMAANHFTQLPVGINYLDLVGFPHQTSLTIGDENNPPDDSTMAHNTFFNCYTGIKITNKFSPDIIISGNYFNASAYNNQYYAIYANVCVKGERCHISNNGVNRFRSKAFYLYSVRTNVTEIAYNSITNPSAMANGTCDKTGIYISFPVQHYGKTFIEGNYISKTQFGIYINKVSAQFAATGGINPAITNNICEVSLPTQSACGFFNYYSYGIWLAECEGAYLYGNNVRGNLNNTQNNPLMTNSARRGYQIDGCPYFIMSENMAQRFNYGVMLHATPVQLHAGNLLCNNFKRCNFGIGFMGVTDIGPIADHDAVNNVLLPSDNEFDSTVVHTVAVNGADLSNPIDPILYYKRSTWPPTVNLFDPNTMSTVLMPINISGESNCYLYTPQFIDSAFICNNDEECRESASGDALNYSIQTMANADSLAAYYTLLRAFKALFNDSTLLVLGVASDTAYQSFYSNTAQSTMGKLRLFEKYMKQNDTLGAKQMIDNLMPQNIHEHMEITTDNYILKYLRYIAETVNDSTVSADDMCTLRIMQSNLSATELSELYNIAYQSAESFGMAVYIARSLLELYVHTPVTSSGYRTEGEQNIENNQISVYPNPSNGMITIEGISNGIITINDMSGRGIYETICNEDGITQLYLQLIDGVYLLKINSSVDNLLTFKLVIIR